MDIILIWAFKDSGLNTIRNKHSVKYKHLQKKNEPYCFTSKTEGASLLPGLV